MDRKSSCIVDYLGEIEDPRRDTANRRHEFIDVLVIALCGMLSSADDWVSIELYGKTKIDWFSSFLSLPNGIPSHDTFSRIFSNIDPDQFMNCFLMWIDAIRSKVEQDVIAIDGKTIRRSHDGKNKSAIHMVSAWANENNLVLGQIKTEEKSNEITAIPELLELISVTHCLVTIDAMGCQKRIAKKIIDRGGDYLLAVKGNQSTLKKAIEATFLNKSPRIYVNPKIDYFETNEKNRDRNEIRRCWTTRSLSQLDMAHGWASLKQVTLLESERTHKGKTTIERRYYISSSEGGAEAISRATRAHWGIRINCTGI